MGKTTATYWNTLGAESSGQWSPVRGLEHSAEELTLSIDENTGEYTRLTRFHAGAGQRLATVGIDTHALLGSRSDAVLTYRR